MRVAPPRLTSLALSFAVVPAVIALPVLSKPQPRAHAVHPSVRTLGLSNTLESGVSAGPVQLVGASWDAGTLRRGTRVEVRARTGDVWSPWTPVEATDGGPDDGSADARAAAVGRTMSEPVWVGHADAAQARIAGGGGIAVAPRNLQLTLVDPGSSDADAAVDPAAPIGGDVAEASVGQPHIYTRANWGADESLRRSKCPAGPDYSSTIKVGFVHHTDTSNSYSASDVPGIIRGIYAYHVKGNGWCDIGYNFLIDRFGRIWEGRYGGITRPVIGAHTGGFNTDAFGVAAIGTFTSHAPPSVMISAYQRLFSWKLGLHYRDPMSKDYLVSAGGGTSRYSRGTRVRFNVVSGHRNAGYTTCPGSALYSRIGAIRTGAKSLMGAAFLSPSLTPRTDSALGSGAFAVRSRVTRLLSWRLTVTSQATGAVIKTMRGTASSIRPLATGWDRRDSHGVPAPKGTYILSLSGGNSSSTARSYTRVVTLTTTAPPRPPSDVFGSGHSDLVTGVPGRTVTGQLKAGAVVVQRGGGGGLQATRNTLLAQSSYGAPGAAERNDRFGSAVATGDFNGDGFSDVAVGIPGEDLTNGANAGMVEVFPGGPDGPQTAESYALSQDSPGIGGATEPGDSFGASLAAGDVNRDGIDDLVIGVPWEDLGSAGDAGMITVVPGSASGLASTRSVSISEQLSTVPGVAGTDDHFGRVLAVSDLTGDGIGDVVVGAPTENVVVLIPGSTSGVSGAGSSAVSGNAAGNAGHFGKALAAGRFDGVNPALAVGADDGVSVLNVSGQSIVAAGAAHLTQNSPSVPGIDEPGDDFGAALAAADLNHDGRADLAVGTPHENVGSKVDAGAVTLLFGSAAGLTGTGSQAVHQDAAGVPGVAEPGDVFGTTVAILWLNNGVYGDLVSGSPGEDLQNVTNGGMATWFLGDSGGLPTTADRIVNAGIGYGTAANPASGDGFASAVADE